MHIPTSDTGRSSQERLSPLVFNLERSILTKQAGFWCHRHAKLMLFGNTRNCATELYAMHAYLAIR